MNKEKIIKWVIEFCNQEGYNNPSEIKKAYEIELLWC